MNPDSKTTKEEERLKEAAAYQNRKLYKALELGKKARDGKQSIRMNPFSAVSQRNQHAAWNAGFNSRDAEIARVDVQEEEKTNEN